MKDGDISNNLLPTILFHSSYILREENLIIFKRLRLRENKRRMFLQTLNRVDINIGVLCHESEVDLVEEALNNYRISAVYTYLDIEDIKDIANQKAHNIVLYVDTENSRGFWFGGRWSYEE